ncbi:Isthmin-1 [Trachymyrmex zeteki]|uniref:Isthmin-1 n=1 Tax=Mycetomoellerius zeteki TaxID=64791 RepID=A0A151WN66_9HYME|nr:Isthmin-1 [Trachymyrmex zeteki]
MFLNSLFSVFQAQISTKARDVECKENRTKSHDHISMTTISSKQKDGNKQRKRVNSSRPRNRTTHRPRKGGNKGTRRKTDRVSSVVKIPESNIYEEEREHESINVWNYKDKNDDADDIHYIRETLDNYYPFHGGLESVLARLIEALENNTGNVSNSNASNPDVWNSSAIDDMSSFDDEDRCQKNRTTHRPRKGGNKGTRRKTDRVSSVVKIPESNIYEEEREHESINVWNYKDKNDDADDIHYIRETLDNYYPFHGGLESVLARLIEALENNTGNVSNSNASNPDVWNSSAIDDMSSFDDEDRCQKWLDNREKIENAFPGSVADLPACPCLYPNIIFYDNQILDKKQNKTYRWRDVSHDKDRLAIYKPGAVYCVQTLASQQSESAIVQHCCYDENRKLLTRGSGAGTPYIVSPEISPLLHDKIDLLPWRLCKGDFTRYNEVRIPNNGNDCEINPNDEEYQHQVESAKDY